jgi:AhpD family alkylhydroperoxidase
MSIPPVRTSSASAEEKRVLKLMQSQYAAVPHSFAFMAHQPAVLEGVSNLLRTIMGNDAVTPRHRELAYLKTALLVDCRLCIANHTESALQVGYSAAHIDAMSDYESSPLFTDTERTILEYVEQVTLEAGLGSEEILDRLQSQLGDRGVVAITQVILIANYMTKFNNALRTHSG